MSKRSHGCNTAVDASKEHQIRVNTMPASSRTHSTPELFCMARKNDVCVGSVTISAPNLCWLLAKAHTQYEVVILFNPRTSQCSIKHWRKRKMGSPHQCEANHCGSCTLDAISSTKLHRSWYVEGPMTHSARSYKLISSYMSRLPFLPYHAKHSCRPSPSPEHWSRTQACVFRSWSRVMARDSVCGIQKTSSLHLDVFRSKLWKSVSTMAAPSGRGNSSKVRSRTRSPPASRSSVSSFMPR
mmetsp:Transcript_65978/g.202051  ORF Transcript_65978/g.202051 Transcript_65978/m.202051 type:complete len:241 (+) Transcript_65978:1487-2209(+)